MHRRTRVVATAAAAAITAGGVLAGGAAAAAPPAAPAAPVSDLEWGSCPRSSPGPLPEGLECTTLEVPLDYQNPDGRTIEVEVSRLPASDPNRRRGVLLLNPGGPGGSGLDMPSLLKRAGMPSSVTERYDLIGFDPRGVGHSTPVGCGLTPEQQLAVLPDYAADADDVARRMTVMEKLSSQCAEAYPDGFLRHITTANTARDMDLIRQALGEEQISYLGYSYGTYLGSVYAQLFPERTDRFILDSAVGPEWVWRKEFRAFGPAGELAFPDFAEWLAARHDEYGLGSTPKQVRQTYFELAGQLDEDPIGALDGTQFRWGTFSGLYGVASYPVLAVLWQSVEQGDLKAVSAAASSLGRGAAAQPEVPTDNVQASQLAILCSDARWPESVEHYQEAVKRDRELFPLFGAMMGNMWPCAAWDADPVEPPVEIDETAAENGILILQNVRDPATMVAGAVQLKQNMGAEAKLVLTDEPGHGVYVLTDNACAAGIATDYLVHGELPDGYEFCPSGSSQRLLERTDNEQRNEAVLELHSRQAPLY